MRQLLRMIGARARGLLAWLFIDPWPVWFAVGVPLATLAAAWLLPGAGELRVRISGYLLTLSGVVLVVKGIRDKRQLFDRPSARERARGWLRRFPSLFASGEIRGAVGMSLGAATVTGTAEVFPPEITNAPTLEERVVLLEEKLSGVEGRVRAAAEQQRREVIRLEQADKAEATERQESDRQLRERLEDLSVGGLDFEAAGVVWVVVGNALTTFPAEVAVVMTRIAGGLGVR